MHRIDSYGNVGGCVFVVGDTMLTKHTTNITAISKT